MIGCLASRRRAAAWTWLLLAVGAALLPPSALADPTARGYRPEPNRLSVVVTTHLVYVTWADPAGVSPTKGIAYRGDGSTCPTGAADGTPVTRIFTNHLMDPTVKAGQTYCYSIFVVDSAGTRVEVGSTGAVPVPDPKAPPPAAVPDIPVQAPAAPASGLDATQVKAIVGSGGAVLALLLLVIILRTLRRGRAANAGPAWGNELRMSLTGLSVAALIIPAVIALAWVLVVTALVVLR